MQKVIDEKKIIHSPLEDLKAVLRYAMMKIGLRSANWPGEEEKALLFSHILQVYGGHTPGEIQLAFDMAISGKLDVEVNCYENFSCMYFSNIMNAYREWAKQTVPHIKTLKPPAEEVKPLTDDEVRDWVKQTKDQKSKLLLLPTMLYDLLFDRQIIQEKWDDPEWIATAINFRQAYLVKNVDSNPLNPNMPNELNNFMRMKNNGFFEADEIGKIKDMAKKIILKEYLKTVPE